MKNIKETKLGGKIQDKIEISEWHAKLPIYLSFEIQIELRFYTGITKGRFYRFCILQ